MCILANLNLWLVITAAAFLLASVGAWLLVSNLPDYIGVSASYHGAMWRQDNLPDISVCTKIGCALYSQIQRTYEGFIAMDVAMIIAGSGLALFAWRKHKKIKSIT
jgi:hypothetical protein